jgi:hypothetical protein
MTNLRLRIENLRYRFRVFVAENYWFLIQLGYFLFAVTAFLGRVRK